MTVGEAKKRISEEEFLQWQAFNRINPIDATRFDFLNALLCHMIYSANSTKNSRKLDVSDFMPKWDGGQKKQTPQEIEAMLNQYLIIHNRGKK